MPGIYNIYIYWTTFLVTTVFLKIRLAVKTPRCSVSICMESSPGLVFSRSCTTQVGALIIAIVCLCVCVCVCLRVNHAENPSCRSLAPLPVIKAEKQEVRNLCTWKMSQRRLSFSNVKEVYYWSAQGYWLQQRLVCISTMFFVLKGFWATKQDSDGSTALLAFDLSNVLCMPSACSIL